MTTPPAQTPPPGAHPTPEVPTPTPVPVHLAVGATGIHLGDLDTEPDHVRRDLAALLREAADVIEYGSDDDLDEDDEP
ncbi:predicted protein [Streptomyces sp. SPB78]|uniref:hypothetical protein n=1 Tax=Streptomyces sp. (strain SPB78) TaxID=591157 RepID=UPI0001B53E25|nr:hypothetical protein [Streptomyces sp. SPB78]EFL00595.1 predicted protein [Streptomyces sp. SPB78]